MSDNSYDFKTPDTALLSTYCTQRVCSNLQFAQWRTNKYARLTKSYGPYDAKASGVQSTDVNFWQLNYVHLLMPSYWPRSNMYQGRANEKTVSSMMMPNVGIISGPWSRHNKTYGRHAVIESATQQQGWWNHMQGTKANAFKMYSTQLATIHTTKMVPLHAPHAPWANTSLVIAILVCRHVRSGLLDAHFSFLSCFQVFNASKCVCKT